MSHNSQQYPQNPNEYGLPFQTDSALGPFDGQYSQETQDIYIENSQYPAETTMVMPAQGNYQQYGQQYDYAQQPYAQDPYATAVYQPMPEPVFDNPDKGHKKSKLGIILGILLVVLAIGGVVFAAHHFGYLNFGKEEKSTSVSDSTSASAKSVATHSSEPIATPTITATKDPVVTSTSTPKPEIQKMNEPDAAAETVATGVKRLNEDSGVPFTKAVAQEVRAHTFVPNETYVIDAYSEIMKKGFKLECEAPSTLDGWVHCSGLDTKGNVQIWVRPRN